MTDDTGMLQHAIFTIPNRGEGYTTDDNARALIFTVLLEQRGQRRHRKDHESVATNSGREFRLPGICRFWSMRSIRRRADSGTFSRYDRRWNEADGFRRLSWARIVGAGNGSGPIQDQGLTGRRRAPVRVLSSRGAGVQQSSRLGLHPARNSGIPRIRIPATATRRKYDPRWPGDCSKCMSRSDGRIGSGLRTFWPTETRDCPKPCCS